MGELGDRLRQAREAKGLSLRQVEEVIFIRRPFLQALEEERFEGLPGDVYTRGFIRNYAMYLGLDPAELLRLYKPAARAGAASPQMLDRPLVPARGAGPVGSVIGGILLVALVGALGWLAYQRFYLQVTPWPFSLWPATQTVAPPVSASPTLPVILPTPIPTQPPEPTAVPNPTETPAPTATPPEPTPTQQAAEAPTATPAPAITVQVEATGATYLDVRGDGAALYVGILPAGQVVTYTANTRLKLRVGNAGVTTLTVNGVVQPPLGTVDQVVEVEYTADTVPKP